MRDANTSYADNIVDLNSNDESTCKVEDAQSECLGIDGHHADEDIDNTQENAGYSKRRRSSEVCDSLL